MRHDLGEAEELLSGSITLRRTTKRPTAKPVYVLERTQPVKEHEPLSYTRSVTETPQLQAAWEHHEENGVEQLIQVFVNELYHDTERDTTYTPPTCLECDMDTIVLALGGKDCLSCNYFTD